MPAFVADLSADQADARLCESLRELQAAERTSVLYFADIMNRRLHRDLGYATIQVYAQERLQFSRSKTGYFIRLASAIKDLPKLRAALTRGELGWSKAALVVEVATRRTERRWIELARSTGRRDLAERVRAARTAAGSRERNGKLFESSSPQGGHAGRASGKAVGKGTEAENWASAGSENRGAAGQVVETVINGADPPADIEPAAATLATAGARPDVSADHPSGAEFDPHRTTELLPAATEFRVRLTAEQRARLEAMLEKLRKLGDRGGRGETILEALSLLVLERQASHRRDRDRRGSGDAENTDSANRLVSGNERQVNELTKREGRAHTAPAGSQASVYQVFVRVCEKCDRGWLETASGSHQLDMATLRAILCDARISRPDEPNRRRIPPRLRRQALERDRYRCQARGCGSHRFLSVHHLHARADGGPHRLENLVTLCNACHTMVHALRGGELALRQPEGSAGPPVAA